MTSDHFLDLIPTAALAKELGVNRRTLVRWVDKGKCPTPKVFNRRMYFERSAIEAWKKSLGNARVIKNVVYDNDREIPRSPLKNSIVNRFNEIDSKL